MFLLFLSLLLEPLLVVAAAEGFVPLDVLDELVHVRLGYRLNLHNEVFFSMCWSRSRSKKAFKITHRTGIKAGYPANYVPNMRISLRRLS